MQQIFPEASIKDLTDAEIAGRIASGDMVALQQLMRRHNQTLYRTARSILKDDAEAEDAVQEAYVLAYRAMGRFRGDAKLSTWLIRIAVHVAIRRARKLNRRAMNTGHTRTAGAQPRPTSPCPASSSAKFGASADSAAPAIVSGNAAST